jgi:hypothetical protein
MTLRGRRGIQFWVEAGLAAITGSLCVLTLFWPQWLEALGLDPDHGSGSAEWFIVAVLFALALVLGLAARLEWRRAATASA